MTRAQIEAARERMAGVLEELVPRAWGSWVAPLREMLLSRLVTAVLGHPDGKAPRQPAGAGRKARRFAR